jgi:hypothetical protein
LRKRAEEANEALLVRMLVELALLRSGYSDEKLEPGDPLASAASRYSRSLKGKRTSKTKGMKCASNADVPPSNRKRAKDASVARNIYKKGGGSEEWDA